MTQHVILLVLQTMLLAGLRQAHVPTPAAQSAPANQTKGSEHSVKSLENCTGDPYTLWNQGKQIQFRACQRMLIFVVTDPLFTKPLAYMVAVKNFNDSIVEVDYTNWRLRTDAAVEYSCVSPERVAKKLRNRARWAAAFAGFSEAMGRSYSATRTDSDGTTSVVHGRASASSSEVAMAQQRAAGPLRQEASTVEDFAFRRTSVLPLNSLLGAIYFGSIKARVGTLLYRLPSEQDVEFNVRLKP